MKPRNIHKASFFWNEDKKRQQYTACGNEDSSFNVVKVSDWAEVTCKYCLRVKDKIPMSTINLL